MADGSALSHRLERRPCPPVLLTGVPLACDTQPSKQSPLDVLFFSSKDLSHWVKFLIVL